MMLDVLYASILSTPDIYKTKICNQKQSFVGLALILISYNFNVENFFKNLLHSYLFGTKWEASSMSNNTANKELGCVISVSAFMDSILPSAVSHILIRDNRFNMVIYEASFSS